jgi:hypothetical protein
MPNFKSKLDIEGLKKELKKAGIPNTISFSQEGDKPNSAKIVVNVIGGEMHTFHNVQDAYAKLVGGESEAPKPKAKPKATKAKPKAKPKKVEDTQPVVVEE